MELQLSLSIMLAARHFFLQVSGQQISDRTDKHE